MDFRVKVMYCFSWCCCNLPRSWGTIVRDHGNLAVIFLAFPYAILYLPFFSEDKCVLRPKSHATLVETVDFKGPKDHTRQNLSLAISIDNPYKAKQRKSNEVLAATNPFLRQIPHKNKW